MSFGQHRKLQSKDGRPKSTTPPPQGNSQESKLLKRLEALETAVSTYTSLSLSENQPSLTPCLTLIPVVPAALEVSNLLRFANKKIKALKSGNSQSAKDWEALSKEVERLEHPEEEELLLKLMAQKSYHKLSKAENRCKRMTVYTSYNHELSSLMKYLYSQCTGFHTLIPQPFLLSKPWFTDPWPSLPSNSEEPLSILSTGKDWFIEELSQVVGAALIELQQEFEGMMHNFIESADYEYAELRREFGQLSHLSHLTVSKIVTNNPVFTEGQPVDWPHFSDYLTNSLDAIAHVASDLQSKASVLPVSNPPFDDLDLSDRTDPNMIRRDLDQLQGALTALEDQANQAFDDLEDGPDSIPRSILASKLSARMTELTHTIDGLQEKLTQAAMKTGRTQLEVEFKKAGDEPLYVISLEDFPSRLAFPLSTQASRPGDDD